MKIRKYRNAVVKLRISAHQLLIETGRHRNIPRDERICELCDKNELEDEFHFLLVCPAYKELRQKYFKKYYYNKPNMIKLIELLNSEKVKILNAIGIFYTKAIDKRKYQLNYISN